MTAHKSITLLNCFITSVNSLMFNVLKSQKLQLLMSVVSYIDMC